MAIPAEMPGIPLMTRLGGFGGTKEQGYGVNIPMQLGQDILSGLAGSGNATQNLLNGGVFAPNIYAPAGQDWSEYTKGHQFLKMPKRVWSPGSGDNPGDWYYTNPNDPNQDYEIGYLGPWSGTGSPSYVYNKDGSFNRTYTGAKEISPAEGVATVILAAMGMNALGGAAGAGSAAGGEAAGYGATALPQTASYGAGTAAGGTAGATSAGGMSAADFATNNAYSDVLNSGLTDGVTETVVDSQLAPGATTYMNSMGQVVPAATAASASTGSPSSPGTPSEPYQTQGPPNPYSNSPLPSLPSNLKDYAGLATTALGALAGSKGTDTSQSATRDLPGFLQAPVGGDLIPRAQGLLNTQYPQAQSSGNSMIQAGSNLLASPVAGNGVGKVTLNAPTTATNPYLPGMADDITRRTQEMLANNNLAIQGNSVATGGLGGSRQGVAQGVAAGKAADYLSGNLASLYGSQYNNDQNRALQQYGMDQSFYGQQRGQDQNGLAVGTGAISQGLQTQWSPLTSASGIYGQFSPFGTTTQNGQSGGGWQGALGGALGAAQLGKNLGLFGGGTSTASTPSQFNWGSGNIDAQGMANQYNWW